MKKLGYYLGIIANFTFFIYLLIGLRFDYNGYIGFEITYIMGIFIIILLDLTLIDIDKILRRNK
jgi:hypothetical protein